MLFELKTIDFATRYDLLNIRSYFVGILCTFFSKWWNEYSQIWYTENPQEVVQESLHNKKS